jgi:8-oxo-dGTP pyrophosphatase MutT (NUDIX family)
VAEDLTRWSVHGSRRVYASEWVNVDLDDVEIPGGRRFDHHVLRFPRLSVGAVVVETDQVLLLWRHRFTTDRWGWEIPAGWSNKGEDPADAALREVEEETGYRASSAELLTTYHPMSGISAHKYRVFAVSGVKRVGKPEAAEASRVEWVPLLKVRELLAAGQVPDGPSLTALAFFLAIRAT